MRRPHWLAAVCALTWACQGSGGEGSTGSGQPLGDIVQYLPDVSPLEPLTVVFEPGLQLSDPNDPITFVISPLDGGTVAEVSAGLQWHLDPLHRYRVTVGSLRYDPVTYTFKTGGVRSHPVQEAHLLTQGLRLANEGEPFEWTLDPTRNQLFIARYPLDPREGGFEYAVVRLDPKAPTGLSTTRITTSPIIAAPVLSPDASVVFLQTQDGLSVADAQTLELMSGNAGPFDPTTLVVAAAAPVAAARRPESGLPFAFGYGNKTVELLFEGDNPGGATISMPNPLVVSGDGRRMAMLVGGRFAYYDLAPDVPDPEMGYQGDPRNPTLYLSHDATVIYEINDTQGGPCRTVQTCELWMNGAYTRNGVALFAPNQSAAGALVVVQMYGGEFEIGLHNPSAPPEAPNQSWPGAILKQDVPELALVDFENVEATWLGDHVLVQDLTALRVVQTATAEVKATVPGVWTAFPRPGGTVLLREAGVTPDMQILHQCPESSCKLQTLPAGLDSAGTTHSLSAGLPFGDQRDRLVKWCEVAPATLDCPLSIQQVPDSVARTAAFQSTPKLNEVPLASYVDAPCYLYSDGGATGLAKGVHCVY